MKKLSVLIAILFLALSMKAQQSIAGIWNTGKDNTTIEISEVIGVYEGKIASSDNAKAKTGKRLLKEIKSVDGEGRGKLFAAKKRMDGCCSQRSEQSAADYGKSRLDE